ncbi:hypothetical protein [Variovorax sp. EL159]|uniref:hypothetical protein n=1 Tax=Variovorax sp. EL159 TaxID=1566270 RepID=UPI00088A61D0|nr:hypothetical protein [Variovorax sp. EL159]SCX74049.1 Flp pilus assembly protein TadD, contains TPR repeats [Variovorax sp. EL159]
MSTTRLTPFLVTKPSRLATCVAATLLAFAVVGCSSLKGQYAANSDAQQRQAFEAAADAKAGTTIDTQATYLKVVEQMQQEGLWFASLAHIDALEQRWGVSPESTRMRGDALRQTGQAALSEDAYKRLMGTPSEGAGYRGLGLLAGARGNFPEAIRMFRMAQSRTPTDALLLSDLGYASLRAGLITDARLPLMQAMQLKPDSQQVLANLALYLEADGQREQATALMDAHRMPEATRASIREAARQLRTDQPLAALPPSAGDATPKAPMSAVGLPPADDAAAVPLALKASRWTAMGGARAQLTPSLADSTTLQSSNPTSRGTQ